ncbi:MAG TPA: DinB family protein [Bryobacteraceae bacterium]|nr:DinB family protein [Bryobacteraceae bacterium]
MKIPVLALCLALSAAAQNPLMQAFTPRYNTMKQNLVEAADAMPAEHYTFKLSPAQRAFSEWIDHTIMLMHGSCATIAGVPTPPMDHSKHGPGKPKSELLAALREAADSCDKSLNGMSDQKALATVDVGGKPTVPVNAMLGLLTNMASHYGNMVGYLRAKNVTPPSTARGQAPRTPAPAK